MGNRRSVVASRYRVVAAARQSASRHRAAQRATPPLPGTVSVGRTGGRTLPAPGVLLWRPNGWYTLRGPHAAPQPAQSPIREKLPEAIAATEQGEWDGKTQTQGDL